ncbi:MAG: flagellar hook-associated protein FlgL [Candidatus Hydrogenedentota bacterium]|nr:MAG: flagellar hook-associated protein FlgL [Candidatus Hydrogenedentota bacterium]
MVSRISNPIIVNNAQRHLQTSLRRLQNTQDIVATGFRIRRPSDDPLGAATALRLRAQIIEIRRFVTNVDRAESFVTETEGALGTINQILIDLREITVAGASDPGTPASRAAAAQEVDAIIEQLVQTANSDFGRRYIFAGHETRTAPFLRAGDRVEYRGDGGLIFEEIGPGNVIPINIPGNAAFATSTGQVIGNADLNPDISAGPSFDTPLSQLNGGNGVQPGSIVITDGSGASATVDLSGAVTISDVIATINSAAGINVTASVNIDGSGLLITDNSGGVDPLQITEDPFAVPPTTTAADLGILGESVGAILGDDLDPIIEGSAVTASTLLSDLNFGAGIDTTPGTFNITDRDGNTVTVDVSAAVTVGDVVVAINAFTGPTFNVTASIAGDGSGIDLTDTVSTGRSQITVTEAGGTTAADLGLLGTGIGSTLEGARLDPAGVPSTPVELLNGGEGFSLGSIRITNGDLTAVVDLSGAVTVGNILAAIEHAGVRLEATIDSTGSRLVLKSQTGDTPIIIVSEGAGATAEDLGLFSPGMFETAEEVRQALLDADLDRLTQLIGNVDDVTSRVISARADAGQKLVQLQFARNRLEDLELTLDSARSKTEEADLTEFAIKLANDEMMYQTVLATTVQVIQPNLFSFLA